MQTNTFLAEIQEVDGKNKLVLKRKDYFDSELSKLQKGKKLRVILEDPDRISTPQHNWFFAYLTGIQNDTGNAKQELYDDFKERFANGESIRYWSKAKTAEIVMMVEAETGIPSPPANNYYYED